MQIVAEVGINWNANFKAIEEMIRQCAIGGADSVKFQLYSSVRVFGDESRKKNEFTFEQVNKITEICSAFGVEFFASVFDEEKLDWCEKLEVSRYKIASRTVIKEPELCKKIIATGKPTLVSLGMWKEETLPFYDENVTYLNCISSYPTSTLDIAPFDELSFSNRVVGLSDHSYGLGYALYAIAHGAKVIEKHFTLSKGMEGNDHLGAMDMSELIQLKQVGSSIAEIVNIAKFKSSLHM